jgi:hypothetical protein
MYNRLSNSQKQRTKLAFAKKREVKKKKQKKHAKQNKFTSIILLAIPSVK